MNKEIERYVDIIEKGLRMIQSSHAAIVISEREEANANNIEDHRRAYAFLNGNPVDLYMKANSKKDYVEVYDTKDGMVKTLSGNVKILKWNIIPQKGDIVL